MKHKLLNFMQIIVASAMMLIVGFSANAQSFSVDGISYNITSATEPYEVEVTSGDVIYSGDVVIPESVTYNDIEYSVLKIGDYAFFYCTGLTSIVIPASVTSIGFEAFIACTGLTSVDIPNSVTSIGESAFSFCSGLTNIVIPNSVTSIGGAAFYRCIRSSSIEIPNSVTEIGDYAFFECCALKSIMIPASVTSMGESAFIGCIDLISIVIEDGNPVYDSRENCNAIIETKKNRLIRGCNNSFIPSSVTTIKREAFSGCYGLTNIKIPASVTVIGKYAFLDCNGLTSIIVERNNPRYDSREDCNAIIETGPNILIFGCKSSFIPNSVQVIGAEAFAYCSGLTNIVIPNSVGIILVDAFRCCNRMTSVSIGDSVTEIHSYAFYGCIALEEINCMAIAPPFTDHLAFSDYSAVLNVPIGSADAYRDPTTEWHNFKTINEVDFTGIEDVVNEDEISVLVNGKNLIINGINDLLIIEVYDISGALIYTGTEHTISVPTNGLYLVKVGTKTVKVFVK